MFEYLYDQSNQTELPFGLDVTSAVLAMASQQRVNGYSLVFSSIGFSDVPQLPATPPQQPNAAPLSKPLNGLPPQPSGFLGSGAVFMWFMSNPILLAFVSFCMLLCPLE
jgi:hypothetical protein